MLLPLPSIVLAIVAATPLSAPATMHVASATFRDGATLPVAQSYNGYGCAGANESPELHWQGAPKGAKSFALTMLDPDAPVRGGWWHWAAFGIPARTHALPAGAGAPASPRAPTGLREVPTSFGKPGYGGPCPPLGDKPHHYIFTIYALDVVDLSPKPTTGPGLLQAIAGHVLGKGTLTGRFGR